MKRTKIGFRQHPETEYDRKRLVAVAGDKAKKYKHISEAPKNRWIVGLGGFGEWFAQYIKWVEGIAHDDKGPLHIAEWRVPSGSSWDTVAWWRPLTTSERRKLDQMLAYYAKDLGPKI